MQGDGNSAVVPRLAMEPLIFNNPSSYSCIEGSIRTLIATVVVVHRSCYRCPSSSLLSTWESKPSYLYLGVLGKEGITNKISLE